jgi:DNA-binding MarR family transcriptional regulator
METAVSTVKSNEVTAYSRFITYRLSQTNAKLSAQAARLLREHSDLSVVQWRILALISAAAPITSSKLVKAVAMDAGLFSRNLKSLISDGLVLSRIDQSDHRQQVLSLSKIGIKRFNYAAPLMQERRDKLTQNISSKDLNVFFSVLDKLEKNSNEL